MDIMSDPGTLDEGRGESRRGTVEEVAYFPEFFYYICPSRLNEQVSSTKSGCPRSTKDLQCNRHD